MESLYFLIPIALVFVVIAIKILFWAIKSGQYDNLESEAHRILFDDEHVSLSTKNDSEVNPGELTKKKDSSNV